MGWILLHFNKEGLPIMRLLLLILKLSLHLYHRLI